jgi:hypothetical protein
MDKDNPEPLEDDTVDGDNMIEYSVPIKRDEVEVQVKLKKPGRELGNAEVLEVTLTFFWVVLSIPKIRF